MNKLINIGLIGAGHIAEIVHLPLLTKLSDVKVIGLFDKDISRCNIICRNYDIPNACDTLDDLLNLNIDAVIISTPNYLHAEQSIRALYAGKHVLCEKPMAVSVVEAESMISASKATQNQLMIGYNNRFRTEVLELYKAIQNGQIGRIKEIRCGWLRNNGIPGIGSWFTKKSFSGGGVLIDIGSHIIDLALWLSGYPKLKKISCNIGDFKFQERKDSWYKPKDSNSSEEVHIDVETDVTVNAVFDNSIEMDMKFSWDCDTLFDKTYIHVVGDAGKAELDTLFGLSPFGCRPKSPLKIWTKDCSKYIEFEGFDNPFLPYTKQYEFFFDSIRNCSNTCSSLEGSLANLKFVEGAYRSASLGQDVLHISL